MSQATFRGTRKALRDLLQAVAAAASGGGAVLLIDAITGNFEPQIGVVIAFILKVVFAFLQNWAETAGKISVLLPTPGLVPSAGAVAEKAVGTVETAVDKVGDVVGDVEGVVEGLGGELLGEVIPSSEEDQ